MVKIKPVSSLKGVDIIRGEWGLISNFHPGSTYSLGSGGAGIDAATLALYSGVGGSVIVDNIRNNTKGFVIYETEKDTTIFNGSDFNGKAVGVISTSGNARNVVHINRVVQLYVTVDGVIDYELNPIAVSRRMFDVFINTQWYYSDLSYIVREGDGVTGDGFRSKVVETGFVYGEESFTITIRILPGYGYVPKTVVYQIGPGVNHIVFDMKLVNYTLASADLPIRINKMKANNN